MSQNWPKRRCTETDARRSSLKGNKKCGGTCPDSLRKFSTNTKTDTKYSKFKLKIDFFQNCRRKINSIQFNSMNRWMEDFQ